MLRKSDCHHIIPANNAAVITWKTLRALKDSCFLSLRLLCSKMLKWLNQVKKPILQLLLAALSLEQWLISRRKGCSFVEALAVSKHAALTFGANKVL